MTYLISYLQSSSFFFGEWRNWLPDKIIFFLNFQFPKRVNNRKWMTDQQGVMRIIFIEVKGNFIIPKGKKRKVTPLFFWFLNWLNETFLETHVNKSTCDLLSEVEGFWLICENYIRHPLATCSNIFKIKGGYQTQVINKCRCWCSKPHKKKLRNV